MARAGRPPRTYALSDWELDEMRHLSRRGWTLRSLASLYGVSERTVQRYLRRMDAGALRADSRPAVADVE